MHAVLVSNLMMLNERERFDALLRADGFEPVWAEVGQYLNEQACLRLVGAIDGWLAGDDLITRNVIASALPRLKVISKWGSGVDSIDLAAAAELGVPVLNSPGAFAQAVAEVALGYMLMLSRHLGRIDRAVREGGWPKPQGRSLDGAQVGIVGFGAIGRRIGEIASGFGAEIDFYDPLVDAPVRLGSAAARPAALEALAEECDFICLACNLTPSNKHMIGSEFLARMRRQAYLVNVARGALVDETALIAALKSGSIAGAALDVFEVEPVVMDNPLARMENVVLGSHNANNSADAVEFVHQNTIANLKKHLLP